MKKLLSLLMLLALITACSDDDDNGRDNNDNITIDDKLIKKVEIVDVSDGNEKPFGSMAFKYDNESRLINVKVEETDYNGGTSTLRETIFTYEGRNISFSTMNEESFNVWLTKGMFQLDKRGKVEKSEVTDGDKDTQYYIYKYEDENIISTHMRTKAQTSMTSMKWIAGNIAMFETTIEKSGSRDKTHEFEKVEYNTYLNNASFDLARMVCFGHDDNNGPNLLYGATEGNYFNITGNRIKNMPSKITALGDGWKVVKDFEYKRDLNDRIYEINVKKVSTYRNEEVEQREYKYLIGY